MFLRQKSGCLNIKKFWDEVESQLFEKLATEPIKGGGGEVRPRQLENVKRTHKDKFSWSRYSTQYVLQCNGSAKD